MTRSAFNWQFDRLDAADRQHLEDIERRCADVSIVDWYAEAKEFDAEWGWLGGPHYHPAARPALMARADVLFAAHAKQDVPYLLQLVRLLLEDSR